MLSRGWRKRRWKLGEKEIELGSKWLDRAKEGAQLWLAILQTGNVSNFAWKLADKAKICGRRFKPTAHAVFSWCVVKCGIDFDRRKIASVELQPL